MNKIITILLFIGVTLFTRTYAQDRMRVIMDNDFAGDPDGLFALAHLVKSPSVDIKAIICSHLHEGENWTEKDKSSVKTGERNVNKTLTLMNLSGKYKVVRGAETAMADTLNPHLSEAAKTIIEETMRCTSKQPLYLLCGGGLTEVASAWLANPEIAKRMILVWIGGAEYPGGIMPPGAKGGEYNTTIDIKAAQVVFNQSDLTIWQIPRNAYRQCLVSYSMLHTRLRPTPVVRFLLEQLYPHIGPHKARESYVLGDSPLVLVSALQTNWERDACSSEYEIQACPTIDDTGHFKFGPGRKIKVFKRIDAYLMFEDMFSKLSAD